MFIILNDMTLFHNIRYLRAKYQLSQRALAKLIGISVYILRSMESETAIPYIKDSVLRRLSAVFDVSIEELLSTELEKIVE